MILLAIIGGLFAYKGGKNRNNKLVWFGAALVALPILPVVIGGIISGAIVYAFYWMGSRGAMPLSIPQVITAEVVR
jgi:hypothetical protein